MSFGTSLALAAMCAVALLALALGAQLSHGNGEIDPTHKEILALTPGQLGKIVSLVDKSAQLKSEVKAVAGDSRCSGISDDAACQTEDSGMAADTREMTGSAAFDPGEFIPTNEWQIVKDGQMIPGGLHIRMDLSTGLKEAKLLN